MAEWWDELSETPVSNPSLGNNAPRIERINDRWKFRASAVGKCPRALLAELYGFTPMPAPAYLAAAAKEGHMHEAALVDDLKQDGYHIMTQQETVELWVDDDIYVKGHTDGLVTYKSEAQHRILEIKSMSDAQYKLWLKSLDAQGYPTFSEHPAYAWQISCYMIAQDLPAVYAVKNRNTGMRKVHWLPEPPRTGEEIKARLRQVIDAYDPTHTLMQADPKQLACDPDVNQFFCPYPDMHEKKDRDLGLEEDTRPIVDVVAAAFAEAVERKKIATKAHDALRGQLIELVGASKVQTVSGHRVDITESKPSRKLNKDKAAAEGIDVDKFYEANPNAKKSYRVSVEANSE